MVIKIQTKSTAVPIEIGELQFSFETNDDSLKRLIDGHSIVTDKLDAIKDGDVDGIKEALKEGFDFILGKGAFKQIYKQTNSVLECGNILFQLVQSLTEELKVSNTDVTQQQLAQNYLKAKKPKKKKNK